MVFADSKYTLWDQTDEDFHREEVISSDEVEPSHEQKITPDNSPQKDPSYVPLKND